MPHQQPHDSYLHIQTTEIVRSYQIQVEILIERKQNGEKF